MHTRALARNIIAVGGRERFQRLVETMRNPKPLWQHWGFNFQIFWFRCEKKEAPGTQSNAHSGSKIAPRGVVSSYKRKEKWTTKRVKEQKNRSARERWEWDTNTSTNNSAVTPSSVRVSSFHLSDPNVIQTGKLFQF